MTNTENLTLKQQFAKECKLINLQFEYTGYQGEEQWAIVSELTADELMEKYPELIVTYIPFVRLSVSQGEAITEFNNIEAKHRMRSLRHGHAFDTRDGEFEIHNPKYAYHPNYIDELEEQDEIERLYQAMSSLSEVQKRRLNKYFFDGKTLEAIAVEEGVTKQSIDESIKGAIKKMKKFF